MKRIASLFSGGVLSALLAFALGGCSTYQIVPVDVALKNSTSLPTEKLQLERQAKAWRRIQFMFELYEPSIFDSTQMASFDSGGRAHLDARNFLYEHEQDTDEAIHLRLFAKLPDGFGDSSFSWAEPKPAKRPDLRCTDRYPVYCGDDLKKEWQLEVWQKQFDLLLAERVVRLKITPEFQKIMQELSPIRKDPPRFVLEYVARQKGSPGEAFHCSPCDVERLERDFWVSGQRKTNLTAALKAGHGLTIEMPVLILTPRGSPEFEERIRLIPNDAGDSTGVFEIPVRTVLNTESLSEITLDKALYDWLIPQLRLRYSTEQMFEAIYAHDLVLVEKLLASGLSPHTRDRHGFPLFYRAIQKGTPEMVNLFLRYGANVEETYRNFASRAQYSKDEIQKDLDRVLRSSGK